MSKCLIVALVAAALVLAAPCLALKPAEVAVVANENSKDSVEIAKAYLKARDIPETNLILVKTTQNYEIGRSDFDRDIRKPVQDALKDRKLDGKIMCLCLIYGVPVRIGASPPTPLAEALKVPLTKAHYRLAIDHQLVGRIAQDFPAKLPPELQPAGKLFSTSAIPVEPLAATDVLLKDIAAALATKRAEAAKLADAANRATAWRQLMAIHQDVYGIEGLLKFVADAKPEGAPAPDDIKKMLEPYAKELAKIDPAKLESAKTRVELVEKVSGLSGVVGLVPPPDKDINISVDMALSLLNWSAEDITSIRLLFANKLPELSVPNMLMWRFDSAAAKCPPILMTARLDGPAKEDVLRMIADSVATEAKGLSGKFYIDAGVTTVGGKKEPSYAEYDLRLKKLYVFLQSNSKMKVVLDEKEEVFGVGACPDAAVYVGWYSLANYVPSFKWVPGAVGFHVASFEAMELRDARSNQWCPRLIRNGVAGTLGPVMEPYLGAFPSPEDFFPLLLTGKHTIAECYWRTIPMTNWRLTLLADPLYNPFAADPQVSTDALPRGLDFRGDLKAASTTMPASASTTPARRPR